MKLSTQKITPFLTFGGNAEEAMNFYVSTFPNSKILSLTRITNKENGEVGKILNGTFELMGHQFMVLDMEEQYVPASSWQISLYINCDTEVEFDDLFSKLSDGGLVMMGPEPVLHFRKCAWITDKFGITWQLTWE